MRYYSLNRYCRDTFGEKLYKLSLDGGMTCPNRDGTLSSLGCLYCSAGGSGDFAADRSLSIKEQLSAAKEKVASKSSCEHFIAYFQAFTNTYAPVDYLRRIFYEAIEDPSVAVLSIGTRTDCFSTEIYDLLSELNKIKPVWIELGLQTIHRSTLDAMYIKQPFELFTLDDYCDFVVDCIERLPKDMVIHRMTGDGPRSLLVAPLWSTDKKRVLNTINKRFEVRDTYQGRLNLF